MTLHPDTREFIALCLSQKVEFLSRRWIRPRLHTEPPRFTEDIDLMILVSPQNADRLAEVLNQIGFGNAGISREDFLEKDQVIQLGQAPHRIDLLTGISGVTWEKAWKSRSPVDLDGLTIPLIGKEDLISNKQASARPQDLADVARLQNSP